MEADTIVAIATPPGRGGIGIVRLSGERAVSIARTLVSRIDERKAREVQYCSVLDEQRRRLDDALLTHFPAPASYTGETVVEIAAHGAPVVLGAVVQRALHAGARLAKPGEFTERAFLNGRIDLTQAEAVRDLIEATTTAQARLAAEQIGGSLSRQVGPAKRALVQLIAELEAATDFAEDDLEVIASEDIAARTTAVREGLQRLLNGFEYGRLLRQGIRLAIVGPPNVGKSSLFNRLLDQDRAIVTPIAGTTRDIVTAVMAIDGVPVELMDTAGLRESNDPVETIGIQRSREAMAEADLILVVSDATTASHAEHAIGDSRGNRIFIANKADLLAERSREDMETAGGHGQQTANTRLFVSALTGSGIVELRAAILAAAIGSASAIAEGVTVSNLRQADALARAIAALDRVLLRCQSLAYEFLLIDLNEALSALDELTGTTTADDILDHIFSSFCIGK